MLRRFVPAAVALTASAVLLGCPLKSKKDPSSGDDDPPIKNAPTVTVTGTGAKNEANVLRYGTETKLPDEPATLAREVKVREFPQTGKEVVTLGAGTPVTKIAKYFSTGVLVIFDDPTTGDGTKLMGWVEPVALAAAPAAPTAPHVAPPLNTTPKPVVAVDAGAKVVVDAGAAAKDAGVKVADAGGGGGGGGGSTPLLLAQPGVGNKCPAGMTIMGPFCRRPCTSQAQCPANTFCTAVTGGRACTATK